MNTRPSNDWTQYAVLSELAGKLGESHSFGKKAMQKVVYLLQEAASVPLGFRFRFYTYGVFSDGVASALDAVESMGGIEARYDAAQNAYQLKAGPKAAQICARSSEFFREYAEELDSLVLFASGMTARTLELISTIVFVARSDELEQVSDDDELVERVAELKPKFDEGEIRRRIQELRRRSMPPNLASA